MEIAFGIDCDRAWGNKRSPLLGIARRFSRSDSRDKLSIGDETILSVSMEWNLLRADTIGPDGSGKPLI